MARGKAHSDETRAEVMAALLAGMSVSEAARKYSLDKSIVSRIRSSLTPDKLQQVATNSEIRIDEMLVNGLRAHLELQQAIATVCANEKYIQTQSAGDLAKLLEVSTSHSIRLLEAASAASDSEPAS